MTRPSGKGPLAAYNTYDARTFFSDLLRRVRAGEEIVIAHAGNPIAKLVPYRQPEQTRPGVVRMTLVLNDSIIEADAGTPSDAAASQAATEAERSDQAVRSAQRRRPRRH